ncbi:MAG: DUF362 domain-containing protein [Deltaproteobacteria bacterium]|nr:DUF362 domain-containing protein [Deltaproteobacteria bacterium]MBW2071014.1 DUF362 domain-containing protein [Deltaproteobacteria bacterium]
MRRRTFLKRMLATFAMALGLDGSLFQKFFSEFALAAPDLPRVATGTNQDYSRLLTDIMHALGGMERFVKPGQRVVVKPNISWDRRPEFGANTNPLVVKRLVELCLEAGAGEVTVMDRPCNDPRRCYRDSGILDAVRSIGSDRAKIKHLNPRRFVEVKLPRGVSLKQWPFYRDALEADVLIVAAPAKQHGSARLSLSMKNIMGLVGGRRERLHVGGLHQHIADLNTGLRADLSIIDATHMMVANGPSGGSLDDVRVLNRVAASADPVAVDSYAATLFGLQGEDIGYIRYGYQMGFGQIDLNKINLVEV